MAAVVGQSSEMAAVMAKVWTYACTQMTLACSVGPVIGVDVGLYQLTEQVEGLLERSKAHGLRTRHTRHTRRLLATTTCASTERSRRWRVQCGGNVVAVMMAVVVVVILDISSFLGDGGTRR